MLTVWKKSLLPNCNGFTVFDCQGNLVFRVDNYTAANKDQIILMDAAGRSLLTIARKQRLRWVLFEGEEYGKVLFTGRKQVNILNSKCLAQLYSAGKKMKELAYEMEGSYTQRCCTFYDKNRTKVADIKPKEAAEGGVAFGTDIFRLIVHPPHIDTTLAMAFLILLDHMFPSR
ncbi:hypothetical protein RJT34_22427 [Clitoria ternatea]|uniref:Protein LURP-one-related 8-like n=1 Tax=Clitoria ternatea TaxID=43366 RepID=A0AAN9IVF3_CLITE